MYYYKQKLYEWIGNSKIELILRGTRDDISEEIFIINVIIKGQVLFWKEIQKVTFLEDMHLSLGQVILVWIEIHLTHFYLH